MQIIIKIPDKQYKNIMEYEGSLHMISDMTLSEINNYLCQYIKGVYTGTPLEDIRAEIEEYKSRNVFGIGIKDLETGKQIALDNVLAIIDHHMKGEQDAGSD